MIFLIYLLFTVSNPQHAVINLEKHVLNKCLCLHYMVRCQKVIAFKNQKDDTCNMLLKLQCSFITCDWQLIAATEHVKKMSEVSGLPGASQECRAHQDCSGKCLLCMQSWRGLTGNRPTRGTSRAQSEEVMSLNAGQLYNWAGGHLGDMERDNEDLELQFGSGQEDSSWQ